MGYGVRGIRPWLTSRTRVPAYPTSEVQAGCYEAALQKLPGSVSSVRYVVMLYGFGIDQWKHYPPADQPRVVSFLCESGESIFVGGDGE